MAKRKRTLVDWIDEAKKRTPAPTLPPVPVTTKKVEPNAMKKTTSFTSTGGGWDGGKWNGGKASCKHYASKTLFEFDKKKFHGGTGADIDPLEFNTVIDLSGALWGWSARFVRESTDPRYLELNDLISAKTDVIRFDWQDYGIPPVGLSFWQKLWELLPEGNIAFCCTGGHGRTGTALASMLVAQGIPATTAIRFIREEHCQNAVETVRQEQYVRSLEAEYTGEEAIVESVPTFPTLKDMDEDIDPEEAPPGYEEVRGGISFSEYNPPYKDSNTGQLKCPLCGHFPHVKMGASTWGCYVKIQATGQSCLCGSPYRDVVESAKEEMVLSEKNETEELIAAASERELWNWGS